MIDPETRQAIELAADTMIDGLVQSYAPDQRAELLSLMEVTAATYAALTMRALEAVRWLQEAETQATPPDAA